MSALEAAGCALSRSHSVSVVPTIQWRPHGITNKTLFSVRRMSPVVELIRSLGTTRWMPLDARTWNWPRSPTIAWVSSVHTPVAFTIWRARISYSPPPSTSSTRAPTTRSPSRRNPVTRALLATFAPYIAAVRTSVATYRASSICAS